MAAEIAAVLALVAVVLLLFVTEWLPVSMTALLAAAALMIIPGGDGEPILSPAEGLSGFSSPATIAVLAMFVLSAGVERSGLVEKLAIWLADVAGKGRRRQVAGLGLLAGPISGFVNNTPVVALLIPVATRMAQSAGDNPSRLLMPMSFFAMVGGTLTIIGTSTNLLANALLPDYGIEPFGFFSFTVIGILALAITMIYFMTIGMRLVPDRGGGDIVERFDLKGFLAEFEVPGDSAAVGKTLADLELDRGHGMQVLRIVRESGLLAHPRRATVIEHGDVLVIQGSREGLEAVPEATGMRSLELVHEELEELHGTLATAELVVAPGSRLEGRTLREANLRDRFDVLVLAVRHRHRVAIGPLARTKLAAGDVLLVQGRAPALEALKESAMFFLTRERDLPSFRHSKMPVALGILAGVVLLAAFEVLPLVVAALAGAVGMVLTRCLRVDEFLSAVRWDIILLLAGIIPLGLALESSGAAALIAGYLQVVGGMLPPIGFLIVMFVATTLITELVSNNASVVLLIPVAIAAATGLDLDPRPFALVVMLAASTSMLTPIGYQTNTMVYAPGSYRFSDFARVGAPLNLLLAIVIPFAVASLFPL